MSLTDDAWLMARISDTSSERQTHFCPDPAASSQRSAPPLLSIRASGDGRPAAGVRTSLIKAWIGMTLLAAALQTTAAAAQTTSANDPTIGFDRLFGLGGHTCKQYDDTGRLYLYSEGVPALDVVSWLQRSDNGTKPNVPMPRELADALPLIPGCLPGKHHAASNSG